MLKHIILLAAQQQQQLAIGTLFKEHNPGLSFVPVVSAQELAAISPEVLRDARLIAFTSGTIVPRETLNALGHGAYNFHPGPPEYPGWAPAHFALYDRAKIFGATAHEMIERVDAGPIVGIETFIMPHRISVRGLEQIAYVRLAYLLWRLARQLATQAEPLPALSVPWGKRRSTRHMYADMCDIPSNITKDELDRRMASFYDDFRGIHPTVTLHGIKFRAVLEPVSKTVSAAESSTTMEKPAATPRLRPSAA